MQLPDPPLNGSECRICRAPLEINSAFCSGCGTEQKEGLVEELRAVLYLLSELEGWQAQGAINPLEAASLRLTYERRRDDLRARLDPDAEKAKPFSSAQKIKEERRSEAQREEPYVSHPEISQPINASSAKEEQTAAAAQPSIRFPLPTRPSPQPKSRPTRTITENLSEPYTLRLLLYTGAAMFVVGVVIWLRDVLYLKLQEPLVQAALLITGTIALTAAGWYTILRTRQRFTGRALTLSGSLLVPVNFWFLVRSGLIENHGRAWVVCAFCTLLYAHTAALLRERLYIYLACAASVGAGWAIVYQAERDAPGLYALVLMISSLVFLHLSCMFPATPDDVSPSMESEPEHAARSGKNEGARHTGRWSRELWSAPLVQAALVCAALCALLYMPLRLGTSPSLYDGIFRLRARNYDSSTAILLFTGVAYVAWFTGRFIDAKRRILFYALSALALLWTEFLILDGLHLSGSTKILWLAATALMISLAARRASSTEQTRALYIAGVFVCVMLAPVAFSVLLGADAFTFTASAGFALLACVFAILSAPRLSSERAAQKIFAYLAAVLASTSFLVALASLSLRSATLTTAACAAWPFVLYALSSLTLRQQRETQLAAPFVNTANVEFVMLLLWASVVALALFLSEGSLTSEVPRAAMFCALFAPLLYGLWRAARARSLFGATLFSLAAINMVASTLDALEDAGVWPTGWPIAAGVICAAFALHKASARWWLGSESARQAADGASSIDGMIRRVLDAAVITCALLWLTKAFVLFDRGNWSAACVLLLALLYWSERVAEKRAGWALHLALLHAGAFFLAMLIALGTDGQWFAAFFALVLAPVFFAVSAFARARRAAWLAVPVSNAAVVAMALAFVAGILQAMPHLQAGDPALLAPAVTMGALALLSFVTSLLSAGQMRVRLFRAGLYLIVITYAFLCLRSGFEPLVDIEVYTSPVAILLLAVAYISWRRAWNDYERDTSLLFWTGSILLAGPLLLRALQFRLLLDEPAPTRDLATLCAALLLIIFGVLGRLRGPVFVGAVTLLIELAALALTSVDWLQVPLKIYLVTVGALFAFVGWMFEYRREQLLLLRSRLNTQRETARERFGQWR